MKRKPKRRPDGRWQRRMNGKLFISSISQEDADRQAKEYAQLLKDGMRRDADTMTFRQYANAWHPRNRSHVSTNTYNQESHRIDVMSNVIGDLLIKDITPSDIQDVYNSYSTGKKYSTVTKFKILITSIFESAVEDGYVKNNPCKSKVVKINAGEKGSHRELEPFERAAIEANTNDKMYPIAMTMLYTGMRPQEALGILIERDVDFDNHQITIHEVRRDDGDSVYYSETGKTKRAVGRVLPLFSPLEKVLKGRTGRLYHAGHNEVMSNMTWQEQ